MKKKIISTDIERIKKVFEEIDEERKILAFELIEELTFMKQTLNDCKTLVDEHGTIELFTQGAYSYNRETPAMKTYNSTIKNYNIVMKQLLDMLPKSEPKSSKDGDELLKFINGY